MTQDMRLEDFLSAITDALMTEDETVDAVANRYHMTDKEEVSVFVNIIKRLKNTLYEVKPSERFVNRLRADLVGEDKGIMARMRHLPPRVRIAAGVMATVGFVLLAHRRMTGEALDTTRDIPPLEATATQQ